MTPSANSSDYYIVLPLPKPYTLDGKEPEKWICPNYGPIEPMSKVQLMMGQG